MTQLAATDSAAALHAVRQHLFTVAKDDGGLYVLLNRLIEPDPQLQQVLEEARIAEENKAALRERIFGTDHERAPLLLRLTTRDIVLLDAAAEVAWEAACIPQQPPSMVCGWIRTDAEPSRVAAHLSRRLNVLLPDRTSCFLRYYDPRSLPRLYTVLTDVQRTQLFGPVNAWLVIGRHGKLIGLRNPQAPEIPAAQALMLDARQADAVRRIEPLNLAVRTLRQSGREVPYADDARLDAAIERALKLGLTKAEDLAAYGALALHWPADKGPMDADPILQRGIELARLSVPLAEYIKQHLSSDTK
jgi:hypothetical protein